MFKVGDLIKHKCLGFSEMFIIDDYLTIYKNDWTLDRAIENHIDYQYCNEECILITDIFQDAFKTQS